MNASFARTFRLTTKAEYSAVFDEQQKLSQGGFLALIKKNDKPYPRIGIIISKRIIHKATSRNYLKRIIREGFRVHKSLLSGLDLVILARKGCSSLDKVKVHKELECLWQRLGRGSFSFSSERTGTS